MRSSLVRSVSLAPAGFERVSFEVGADQPRARQLTGEPQRVALPLPRRAAQLPAARRPQVRVRARVAARRQLRRAREGRQLPLFRTRRSLLCDPLRGDEQGEIDH